MAKSYLCKNCLKETLKRTSMGIDIASYGFDSSKLLGMKIIKLGFWFMNTQIRFKFFRVFDNNGLKKY